MADLVCCCNCDNGCEDTEVICVSCYELFIKENTALRSEVDALKAQVEAVQAIVAKYPLISNTEYQEAPENYNSDDAWGLGIDSGKQELATDIRAALAAYRAGGKDGK